MENIARGFHVVLLGALIGLILGTLVVITKISLLSAETRNVFPGFRVYLNPFVMGKLWFRYLIFNIKSRLKIQGPHGAPKQPDGKFFDHLGNFEKIETHRDPTGLIAGILNAYYYHDRTQLTSNELETLELFNYSWYGGWCLHFGSEPGAPQYGVVIILCPWVYPAEPWLKMPLILLNGNPPADDVARSWLTNL